MAWSTIAAAETDADSPLNQTLFDKIRNNLDYLYSVGSQVVNYTGSEAQARSSPNHYVINDTIDWRNRNIHAVGIVCGVGHTVSATALANAEKILPGGSEVDEVFFDVSGNGTNGAPNISSGPDEYDFVNGFMHTGAGGAVYNTKPYLTYPGIDGSAAITDFYLWVDSGNSGRLVLSILTAGGAGTYLAAAWNLQINYSGDLS